MKWKFPLFVSLILSICYVHFFENRAYIDLNLEVSQRTWFKIYWAGDGEKYSEKRMHRIRVHPAEQHYTAFLTDLRKVKRLRIDPHDYIGSSLVKDMAITQNGLSPLIFKTEEDFFLLKPVFDIASSEIDSKGLTTHSTGVDPNFELLLTVNKGVLWSWGVTARIVFIFAAVVLFFFLTKNYRVEKKFIPLFFALVFALIIVMASSSTRNVHPDEYVHLNAAQFYTTNWLPPVIDDPDIRHTYSIYGMSRLNSHEVSYFFTGKLAQLMSLFKLSEHLNLRLFNVLLFGVLLLYILKNQSARIMAVPLLISPQLWYIFSYCNSDAFALFVSFIIACQIVLPSSLLNKYLLETKSKTNIFIVVLFGIVCAFLFLLKKNYIFFTAFLIGYVLWKVLFLVEQKLKKQYLKRVIVIVLIGVSFAGSRMAVDYVVNGWDRAAKIEQTCEVLAHDLYKPSTPLEQKHSFLYRKARGETLETIIVVARWFEKTYRSAFGMYGYFTTVATDAYYNSVRPVGIALFALLFFAVVFRGGVAGNLLLLFFIGSSGLLVAASLYHAWTVDFQTQGRYLFPIIPMSCIILHHFRHLMQGAVYKLLVVSMFLLSIYSFVFIGLIQLPKIS